MRILAPTLLAAAALAVPAARAAEAPLTPARAHSAASARLLGYVLGFSYVVDYDVTRCAIAGDRASCSYRVAWYGGEACTGTIAVTRRGSAVKARFVPPLCRPPAEATAPPAAPSPPPPPAAAPPSEPTPAPAPPPGPAKTRTIADIAADDASVTLDDGSRWTVAAAGRHEVDDWEDGDVVAVEAGADSTFTLTNVTLGDGVAVTATFAGSA